MQMKEKEKQDQKTKTFKISKLLLTQNQLRLT